MDWLYTEIERLTTRAGIHMIWNMMDDLLNQAKDMEKLQHGYTWDSALEYHEKRGYNLMRTIDDFDDYWENKFGGENDN